MIQKYQGIIFKTIPYSETSLVLDIYTRAEGLRSYIVSGVRKKKSKLISLYKPMSLISFVAYTGDKVKLYRIKEAEYNPMFTTIPKSVTRSTMGMFMIDVCRNSIREKEGHIELYDFIYNAFLSLDQEEKISSLYHLDFILEFTKYLGFYPGNEWSEDLPIFHLEDGRFIEFSLGGRNELSIQNSKSFGSLLKNRLRAQMDKESKVILLDKMIKYFQYHVTGFKDLPSLAVLKSIFS